MKKKYIGMIAGLALFSMAGLSQAELITIGTAQFEGDSTAYNLIWDDDNNGNSVVWLDYTNVRASWLTQSDWAAGLDSSLTYNIYDAYTIDWDTHFWRLPSTVDGEFVEGNDGTTTAGYNITSSEMGHLYYTELGNLGLKDTSGVVQSVDGLINTGEFENLLTDPYWSGTTADYSDWLGTGLDDYWVFVMQYGQQFIVPGGEGYFCGSGLAVRNVQVYEAASAPVPEPGTILLFGTGLAGFATLKIKQKRSRV